jgi:hypothetical protein
LSHGIWTEACPYRCFLLPGRIPMARLLFGWIAISIPLGKDRGISFGLKSPR